MGHVCSKPAWHISHTAPIKFGKKRGKKVKLKVKLKLKLKINWK